MEPVLLLEEKLECPYCKLNTLSHKSYLHEIPTGLIQIEVFECEKCGFKIRDVRDFEEKAHIKIEIEIKNETDLNIIIYKSKMAKIKIPELGIEIEPGLEPQSSITTVEGILEEILDKIGPYLNEEKRDELEKAKMGKIKFKIIIEDPSGLSFIKNN
jgi:zinc finger protein